MALPNPRFCFDEASDKMKLLLVSTLLGLALLVHGNASAAEEAFVPRDLAACAPERPTGGYALPCKQTITPAEAAGLLAQSDDKRFAYRIDGDALTIVANVDTKDVLYPNGPYVCCEMQAYLDKMAGDVYAARFRWNLMSKGMFDLSLLGVDNRPDVRVQVNGSPEFAVARSGAGSTVAAAAGYRVVTDVVEAGAPLGARKVTIVRGPDCLASLTGCSIVYMPDGESAQAFLANALANGIDMRRAVVVGIHNDDVDPISRRIEELLFGVAQPRYDAFMHFATADLVRYVEGSSKPLRRIAAGYSNGGAWALDALVANPDVFDGAIIMSPAQWKFRNMGSLAGHRAFVGAGFMERGYQSSAAAIAAGLRERGAEVGELYVPSGHSMNTWINVWNKAMREFDGARSP